MSQIVAEPTLRMQSEEVRVRFLEKTLKELNECQSDLDIQRVSSKIGSVFTDSQGCTHGNILEAIQKAELALRRDGQLVKANRMAKVGKLMKRLPTQSPKKQRKMLRAILKLCAKNVGVNITNIGKRSFCCGSNSLLCSAAVLTGSVLVLAGATTIIAMAATGEFDPDALGMDEVDPEEPQEVVEDHPDDEEISDGKKNNVNKKAKKMGLGKDTDWKKWIQEQPDTKKRLKLLTKLKQKVKDMDNIDWKDVKDVVKMKTASELKELLSNKTLLYDLEADVDGQEGEVHNEHEEEPKGGSADILDGLEDRVEGMNILNEHDNLMTILEERFGHFVKYSFVASLDVSLLEELTNDEFLQDVDDTVLAEGAAKITLRHGIIPPNWEDALKKLELLGVTFDEATLTFEGITDIKTVRDTLRSVLGNGTSPMNYNTYSTYFEEETNPLTEEIKFDVFLRKAGILELKAKVDPEMSLKDKLRMHSTIESLGSFEVREFREADVKPESELWRDLERLSQFKVDVEEKGIDWGSVKGYFFNMIFRQPKIEVLAELTASEEATLQNRLTSFATYDSQTRTISMSSNHWGRPFEDNLNGVKEYVVNINEVTKLDNDGYNVVQSLDVVELSDLEELREHIFQLTDSELKEFLTKMPEVPEVAQKLEMEVSEIIKLHLYILNEDAVVDDLLAIAEKTPLTDDEIADSREFFKENLSLTAEDAFGYLFTDKAELEAADWAVIKTRPEDIIARGVFDDLYGL